MSEVEITICLTQNRKLNVKAPKKDLESLLKVHKLSEIVAIKYGLILLSCESIMFEIKDE